MYTPLAVCNPQSLRDFLRYISTRASKLVRKKHSVATVKGPAQVARSPAKISFTAEVLTEVFVYISFIATYT